HSLAEARAVQPGAGKTPELSSRAREVLLVEDNPLNQRLAVRILEKLGCEVKVAENGRIALRLLESQSYDIVFMDCQMPEMDGYSAARERRASQGPMAKVPVVAMTANAMRGDRDKCLAAGMDDYVSKPIGRDDFVRMLERWCGQAASESVPGGNSGDP